MRAAREFFLGIVDYAGLFPPASLDMAHAVTSFATYLDGPDRDLLGRFILPVGRLDEFSSELAASRLKKRKARTWRLAVIPQRATISEAERIRVFNQAQGDSAPGIGIRIDAVEMPVKSIEDVRQAVIAFGKFEMFLEPVGVDDPSELLMAIAAAGAGAKLRTGGTTAGSTPEPQAVVKFIAKCAELGIRFKATAGLHHALRGVYKLTYAHDAESGPMFGYLNIFLAAVFLRAGLPAETACDLLEESASSAISFDQAGAKWREHRVTAADLAATRRELAHSFGSCSFTEPVEEARQLQLI